MKTLLTAALLAAPVLPVWFWYNRPNEAPASAEYTIHRMPIEIIVSQEQPEWVLVPIDPR